MSDLQQRLRRAADTLRRTSMPLADLIPLLQQAADALEAQPAQAVRSKLGAGVPMQTSEGEFAPNAKLLELADKIDHEQNWQHSGIFQRDHLTQDQKDRVLAGVMLRRYADLMAPESWRLFPPARADAQSYRASTLDAVVKMAQKYCRAAIEAERGGA